MHLLAALVAAGLLAAAPAVPGGAGDARIDAGSTVYDVDTGTWRLSGGVVVTRGAIRLRARSATWDPRTGAIDAAGEVLLTDATHAVAAEGLHAVLDGDFEASKVVVFLKAGPADLASAADAAAAGACGQNAGTAQADRLSRQRGGPYRLEGARVTLCGCPEGPPSWEVRAAEARVEAGERIELWWPVVWVTPRFLFIDRPVPILVLPYVALPLSDRVGGLLPTTYGRSGNAGQVLTQPIYLTLGRSADLTVGPRYAFGRKRTEDNPDSTSGPGLMLEWRAAPSAGSGGRLQADLLWDLQRPDELRSGLPGARRLRLGLGGGWTQQLWDGALLDVGVDLVSDPLYGKDFTFDPLERGGGSRRSTVLATDRLGPVALELSAAWLEPVEAERPKPLPDAAHPDLAMIPGGLFGGKLPGFHRWPSLAATLAPVALPLGLELSGRAGVSRFAPPTGVTSDGGADGAGPADRGLPGGPGTRIWTPWQRDPLDPTELDGHWQPGERLAVTRLDARAELAAPLAVGPWLSARPFVRASALGYRFDAEVSPLANAWVATGVDLSTRLVRRDGEWRQLLEPRLAWRWGSAVAGRALPAFGYDGLDRAPAVPAGVVRADFLARIAAAAPAGSYQQGRLELGTRLDRAGLEVLRGAVTQDLDLRRGRLAELGLSAAVLPQGPVVASASVSLWPDRRWDGAPAVVHRSWLDHFTEASFRLKARDPRGDTFTAGLSALGAGGSGRLTGGDDALFGTQPTPLRPLALADLGLHLRFGAATLGYQVTLPARAQAPLCDASNPTRTVGAWRPQQHVASLEWESPCRCFRLKAAFKVDDCGAWGFEPTFDLGPITATAASTGSPR